MFEKMLIGMDGSEDALRAARLGAQVAARCHSKALVMNVFSPSYSVHLYLGISEAEQRMQQRAQWQEARLRVETLPIFTERNVPCEFQQTFGHPVESLIDAAKDQAVDLIVVGSRGLTGVREWVMGSVSSGVLHHAPCSVLIARGEEPDAKEGDFRRILLVSDGSDGAAQAAQAAIGLAQRFATSLTVLNVYEEFGGIPLTPPDGYIPPDAIDTEAAAKCSLEAVKESVLHLAKEPGVYCAFHQEIGHDDETIVRFAKEHAADLIVMGSRGLGGFERMLLGSVSDYVAHHAACPVLIAR